MNPSSGPSWSACWRPIRPKLRAGTMQSDAQLSNNAKPEGEAHSAQLDLIKNWRKGPPG